MFASKFSTPRVHIFKSFQRQEDKNIFRVCENVGWKQTNKQQSNKSPTPVVMLGKPPDTRKAVGFSRAGNPSEVLWCSPQAIVFPGVSPYRHHHHLWEDPQFLLGLKVSRIAWSYGTVRKEKRNSLVWYDLVSVMTGRNDEESVDSKILVVKEADKELAYMQIHHPFH